jgi:hypothetical protein
MAIFSPAAFAARLLAPNIATAKPTPRISLRFIAASPRFIAALKWRAT